MGSWCCQLQKGSKDAGLWSQKGSRDGVVVIAPASHLRGPSSGHEWVKLVVGSLLCSERFFSGFSGFPLSSFDRMQDLPETTFGCAELPG